MTLQFIQQPPIINFSGNPIPYSMAIAPYGITERNQDLRIKVMVEVEIADYAEIYTEIHDQVYYPDINGKTGIDISSITQSYLTYYIPRYSLNSIQRCENQSRRFRIKIILQKDGALVGDPIITTPINVIKGGMAYEHWHQTQFFTKNIGVDRKPLHFYQPKEWVGPQDKKYMYWLYSPTEDSLGDIPHAEVHFLLANGADLSFTITNPLWENCRDWKIYCMPIGLADLIAMTPIPEGDFTAEVVRYTVTIIEAGIVYTPPIIATQTFWVDHRNFYNPAQIVFTNSLGGMDTIRLLGDVDFAAEFNNNQATQSPPPSGYINGQLQAQNEETDTERTEKFSGATDFVPKQTLMQLSDIFTAANKMEVKQQKFFPVIINKKTVKFYNSKDSLQSMQLEWVHAFANTFYTPYGNIAEAESCPAMLSFAVVQVSRTTLQILWSCPMPYDLIEIEIDNGDPDPDALLTIQLFGNSGSQMVEFVNFAIPGETETMTVKAKVVCNPDSDPVDYGPQTAVTLEVAGNNPPIANDDILVIAAGYNTAQVLTGSVLANDYDPDGDAIEAFPDTGATDQGGTFDIDINGIVTYTPPSSAFNGVDFFYYVCREVAEPTSSAAAKCSIHVGNIALGSATYVKIVERNHRETWRDKNHHQVFGDWYITFWYDPAALIPKIPDPGISVNLRHIRQKTSPTFNTWYEIANTLMVINSLPSSPEVLFFSGEYYNMTKRIHIFGHDWIGFRSLFTLEAGTGYLII